VKKIETPKFALLLEGLEKIVGPEDAVLVGSAPLAIREIRDVNDLDVLVRSEVFDVLREVSGVLGDGADRMVVFQTPEGLSIQITDRLLNHAATAGITEEDVWSAAEEWRNWRVLNLQQCRRIKEATRREKDYEDLALIRHFLGTLASKTDATTAAERDRQQLRAYLAPEPYSAKYLDVAVSTPTLAVLLDAADEADRLRAEATAPIPMVLH
jgi:hypothetical protein